MPKSIFRYEVPIDDKPHTIELTDFPIAGAVQLLPLSGTPYLEFWAGHDTAVPAFKVTYQVYGTGHEIPSGSFLTLTAPRISGLVFHLVELGMEADNEDQDGS